MKEKTLSVRQALLASGLSVCCLAVFAAIQVALEMDRDPGLADVTRDTWISLVRYLGFLLMGVVLVLAGRRRLFLAPLCWFSCSRSWLGTSRTARARTKSRSRR